MRGGHERNVSFLRSLSVADGDGFFVPMEVGWAEFPEFVRSEAGQDDGGDDGVIAFRELALDGGRDIGGVEQSFDFVFRGDFLFNKSEGIGSVLPICSS